MNAVVLNYESRSRRPGFTLVEMLVVIAIMSILMTAGAIGLSGMGGKGVTSGVASAESLFDEARSIAVGQRTRARVLVCKDLTDKSTANASNRVTNNLRRIIVVSAELDPATGREKSPENWIVSSRGIVLPDQTFFSQDYSKLDFKGGGGSLNEVTLSTGVKETFKGTYFSYEFNAEGLCTTPGASFVIGAGSRSLKNPDEKPRVTSAGKRDFGGFVVWRNGRTSTFRSPTQISADIDSINTGAQF